MYAIVCNTILGELKDFFFCFKRYSVRKFASARERNFCDYSKITRFDLDQSVDLAFSQGFPAFGDSAETFVFFFPVSDDMLSEDSRDEPTREELIEVVSQLEEPKRKPRAFASSSRSLPLPRRQGRHRGQVTRMLRSNQKGHEEENLLDELFFHQRH